MTVTRKVVACLLACVVLAPPLPATAQEAPKSFKPEELDQLVAPIALHPDPLLAQILMASSYPLEVVQAARFVKEHPTFKGDQLNEALKQQTWDDSVKSLTAFPQVLTMMNDKLDWLQKLGDAFLGQQKELMDAVQRLRSRAEANGQLKSTSEQKVIVEPAPAPTTTVQVVQAPPTIIKIEPASPQVVYVPTYNPTVVYGAWPYPAYPPYYPYPAGYFAAGAFTFAAGVAVGSALWGNCNWGHGDVNVNVSHYNSYTNNVNNVNTARVRAEQYSGAGASGTGGQRSWQHDPEHRKGVQYRDTATQQRYNKTGPANAQARESFRGRTASAQQGALGQQSARDRQGTAGQQGGRGQQGSVGQQGGAGRGPQAATSSSGVGQGGAGQTRQAGAFEGMGSGRDTQSFSNRGNTSRESYNRSSGAARSGGGARGGGRR